MSSEQESEKLGYGRPPKQHRFPKGQSGNPKGRPKGSRNLKTALASMMDEKVTITEGGKRITLTKREAMLRALFARGIGGKDTRAAAILVTLDQSLFPELAEGSPERNLTVPETEIIEALEARVLARMQRRSRQGGDKPDGEPA